MNVSNLAQMVEQHKLDKNYQHRDKSWDQIDVLAKASFARLSPEKRAQVMKVCAAFGLIDEKTVIRARFMAQTNLFFLCHMLGYKDMWDHEYVWVDDTVHNTHEEICNDFFVRKDPTIKTFKEFASGYIEQKQRLLLVPRGGFKSTMNMADCVQWIISFPEVTILVLSGVLKLAEKFIGEIKGHFTLEEGSAEYLGLLFPKKSFRPKELNDDDGYSVFQMLFAEHCVPVDDGKAAEFQTPATSAKGKEPTVFGASIEQNLAGFHMGVLKLDDVVTNENSLTAERIKGVNKQVSINQAMLMPYGFYDKIGTWYDSEDTYGVDIKNSKKYEAQGLSFPMKIYIRAGWWPNNAARKTGKIPEEMTKADYGLWFDHPSHLCYEFLAEKFITDEYFAIKYLNDPTVMHTVKFPRELLVRKTCTGNELPGTGMIVTCIDTAYSQKSWADYTVIITALIFGGRFFIIDMVRGRFNEYELPAMIAATALKWKPKHICIEDTGKAEKYVQREAYREMDKLKVRCPIRMVTLGQGTSKKSKAAKAGPVLRYLGDDRMKFVNTCPGLEELYDEMSKFGTASSTHDDIVDALAILVNEFAGYADAQAKIQAAELDFSPDPKGTSFYNQVYGLGKFDKFNAHNLALGFPENAPDTLAKQAAEEAAYANNDPFADLM